MMEKRKGFVRKICLGFYTLKRMNIGNREQTDGEGLSERRRREV